MKFTTKIEKKFFVNDVANITSFEFDFDFNNFVNKSLSIYFIINFNEIVIDDKKINNEKIVNIDKIIHEI